MVGGKRSLPFPPERTRAERPGPEDPELGGDRVFVMLGQRRGRALQPCGLGCRGLARSVAPFSEVLF